MFTGDRSSRFVWLVTVWLGGCGGEASAPAAAPAPALAPEFDDPFADDAAPAAAAKSAEVEKTEAGAAEAGAGSPVEAVAEAGSPGVVAAATVTGAPEAAADAAAARSASVPAASSASVPAAGSAGATSGAVARRKSAKAASPVPQDTSPVPAPTPAPAEPKPADSATVTPTPVPAPAPAPAPVPAPPPGPERFAGDYGYVGGQAQRDGVAAAIEATVMALNVMFRPIARKRITEGNPLREQLGIAVAGKSVTVSFGADRKVSGTLDGPAVTWSDEAGSPLKVTFSLVKGRIVMHCQGEGGARRNVFTLDESGDKVTMSVTMSSDRLPVPVKYALTYRRK